MIEKSQKAWSKSVVLITGAGSGIGRALAINLSKRGATVIVSDINLASASKVAKDCGAKAIACELDVCNFNAVNELITSIPKNHGSLDYLFNNAGIAIGGEAYEISIKSWERILDINLKGVINGICSAYPLMIKQGSGHIINTASLAGLGPAPLLTPYSMTKHAVVGLSTSLRIEAVEYGIGISVLCPAAIETPLLDSEGPLDLIDKNNWRPDFRRFLTVLGGPPYPVEKLAEDAIHAIEKNKGIIVIPGRARLLWRLGRMFPALVEKACLDAVKNERNYKK